MTAEFITSDPVEVRLPRLGVVKTYCKKGDRVAVAGIRLVFDADPSMQWDCEAIAHEDLVPGAIVLITEKPDAGGDEEC